MASAAFEGRSQRVHKRQGQLRQWIATVTRCRVECYQLAASQPAQVYIELLGVVSTLPRAELVLGPLGLLQELLDPVPCQSIEVHLLEYQVTVQRVHDTTGALALGGS